MIDGRPAMEPMSIMRRRILTILLGPIQLCNWVSYSLTLLPANAVLGIALDTTYGAKSKQKDQDIKSN